MIRKFRMRAAIRPPKGLEPFSQADGALQDFQEMTAACGPSAGIGIDFPVLKDMQAVPMAVAENDDIKSPGHDMPGGLQIFGAILGGSAIASKFFILRLCL